MARWQVGVITELYRYPIKSMLGERLNELEVGSQGIIGDRCWALREANGRIVSAKKWANMFGFTASYESEPQPGSLAPLRITLPDGRQIRAQDEGASQVISELLGRPLRLELARPDERSRAEIEPSTVFGDVGSPT